MLVQFSFALCIILRLNLIEANLSNENRVSVSDLLGRFNNELQKFRHYGAELAWNMSFASTPELLARNEEHTIERNTWTNQWCTRLIQAYDDDFLGLQPAWPESYLRQVYLICRGPRFTSYQLSNILSIMNLMKKAYNREICVERNCMRIEPDLTNIMAISRDEAKLRQIWTEWHKSVGPEVKPLYVQLVHMLNEGARQSGHRNMGHCWRQETEVPKLISLTEQLYDQVKYLYKLLHSFVRYKLENFYKIDLQTGPIPVHLLGNMYPQNWASLIDIVWDTDEFTGEKIEENPFLKSMMPVNSTLNDMIKGVQDFYLSMGFPKLPSSFWEKSFIVSGKESNASTNTINCHGSAVNMFAPEGSDFRIMMCGDKTDETLKIFLHELGHIYYFMAYDSLPTVFKDGANSAFHEAVGDSLTYDIKPASKHSTLFMKNLLLTALTKLPQIGYGLIMDLWRWDVFANEDMASSWNLNWWKLQRDYLGVMPPKGHLDSHRDLLDAAGKFHVIDNIPYIRYFLGSFLQMQFYEAMCDAAGYLDMHQCKIHGSEDAGTLMWKMMAQGSSKHWSTILEEITGDKNIRAEPLLRYFRPLQKWLEKQVIRHNLTITW